MFCLAQKHVFLISIIIIIKAYTRFMLLNSLLCVEKCSIMPYSEVFSDTKIEKRHFFFQLKKKSLIYSRFNFPFYKCFCVYHMAPVRFEGFHLLFKNLSEVSFHKLIHTGYFLISIKLLHNTKCMI